MTETVKVVRVAEGSPLYDVYVNGVLRKKAIPISEAIKYVDPPREGAKKHAHD